MAGPSSQASLSVAETVAAWSDAATRRPAPDCSGSITRDSVRRSIPSSDKNSTSRRVGMGSDDTTPPSVTPLSRIALAMPSAANIKAGIATVPAIHARREIGSSNNHAAAK